MAIISKTFTFSAGATIIASEHNTNLDTLYNAINGNLDNANISATAAIAATKLNLSTISQSMALGNVSTVSILDGSADGLEIGTTTAAPGKFSTLKVGTTNQGDVLYDNGTSLVRLPPGTSGHVLFTGGAAANPSWGSVTNQQLFTTAGANSWTAPAGVYSVMAVCLGGGGGGAGGWNTSKAGGAGGSGGTQAGVVFVTPGNSYTADVATTAAGSTSNGATGDSSTFTGDNSGVVTGGGGGGGFGGTGGGTDGNAGSAGSGSVSGKAFAVSTQAGTAGEAGGTDNTGGVGANSAFGNGTGGTAGVNAGAGGNASNYAAGGGGGGWNTGSTGGNGAQGFIILFW